jgi:hypothetical protein
LIDLAWTSTAHILPPGGIVEVVLEALLVPFSPAWALVVYTTLTLSTCVKKLPAPSATNAQAWAAERIGAGVCGNAVVLAEVVAVASDVEPVPEERPDRTIGMAMAVRVSAATMPTTPNRWCRRREDSRRLPSARTASASTVLARRRPTLAASSNRVLPGNDSSSMTVSSERSEMGCGFWVGELAGERRPRPRQP